MERNIEEKIDDPLLKFFLNLLKDDQHKEIVKLIFNGKDQQEIVEKLIGYLPEEQPND